MFKVGDKVRPNGTVKSIMLAGCRRQTSRIKSAKVTGLWTGEIEIEVTIGGTTGCAWVKSRGYELVNNSDNWEIY